MASFPWPANPLRTGRAQLTHPAPQNTHPESSCSLRHPRRWEVEPRFHGPLCPCSGAALTSSTKRLPPRTMNRLADPRQHRYRGAIPKILVEPAKPLGQFLLLKRGWRVAIGLHPLFRREEENCAEMHWTQAYKPSTLVTTVSIL